MRLFTRLFFAATCLSMGLVAALLFTRPLTLTSRVFWVMIEIFLLCLAWVLGKFLRDLF